MYVVDIEASIYLKNYFPVLQLQKQDGSWDFVIPNSGVSNYEVTMHSLEGEIEVVVFSMPQLHQYHESYA